MKKRVFVPIGISLLLLSVVPAMSYAIMAPYDNEIQISGSFFHAQGSDVGTLNADASYGKFLANPAWQVGIRQGLSYSFIDDGRDQWIASTLPYLNYHFIDLFGPRSTVVPYLGASAGVIWNDRDNTGALAPAAGAKFFLNEYVFLNLRYQYEWFFDSLSFRGATRNSDDGNHVALIGLGFVWGGQRTAP
jgi:hypothetical protein